MAIYQPSPRFHVSQRELDALEERAAKWMVAGVGVESIGAIGGIVLSILGIIGLIPMTLASIALIVLGASLFAEAAAVGANLPVVARDTSDTSAERVELAGGLSISSIGSIAVVALGILSLLAIVPHILLPVGVITLGAAALLSSGEKDRMSRFPVPEPVTSATTEKMIGVSYRASVTSAGLEVLASLATIVLGILALVGIMPLMMTLVGLLVVSSSTFLSSAALSTRLAPVVRR